VIEAWSRRNAIDIPETDAFRTSSGEAAARAAVARPEEGDQIC
jgi:hypothetical protein